MTSEQVPITPDPDERRAEIRAPLTVVLVLAPLGLLAQLYRFVSHHDETLFIEEQIHHIGQALGIHAPLLPVLLLILGGLFVHLVYRHPWRLPHAKTILLIVAWAALWTFIRYVVGITAAITTSSAQAVPHDGVTMLTKLGFVGIALSAALQEELLFRAGCLGVLVLAARGLKAPPWVTYAVLLPLSAVFFAIAHTDIVNHTRGAIPFTWPAFVQWTLAGVLYGYVFLRQGLATCTLAHTGYNVVLIWGIAPLAPGA